MDDVNCVFFDDLKVAQTSEDGIQKMAMSDQKSMVTDWPGKKKWDMR